MGEAQQLIKAGVRSGPRYLACLRKAAEALRLGRAPLAEVLAVAAHKVGWGARWNRVAHMKRQETRGDAGAHRAGDNRRAANRKRTACGGGGEGGVA